MAGKYGTYRIAEDCHVTVPYDEPELDAEGKPVEGAVADVDLVAGEFTPSTAGEAAACAHLCGISRQAPGDESSHVLAELVDGPDPEPQQSEPQPEPAGSQPPATAAPAAVTGTENPPAGTGTTAPTGGPAEPEPEEAKAPTDTGDIQPA